VEAVPVSVNPHARTERSERNGTPRDFEGCELAHETHRMLVGSDERQGVFEQLRNLHTMVRTRGNLIVAGVWVIAICSAWSTYWR
jgi:hypothetical protein